MAGGEAAGWMPKAEPYATLPAGKPAAPLGCTRATLWHAIGEVPGVGDDGAQVGVLRGPAQAVAELLAAGDQGGGIAIAARANHVGNFLSGDFLHRADHFQHAAASARSYVELVARAAVQQVLDGQD